MSNNPNSRLEAFCDGVFAFALTLLVIDIKAPMLAESATNVDMWVALKHLLPNIFAFLLSFAIILITWVNHHNSLKLVDKSSPHFTYANGFFLLTIVFIPFPTALLGESLFTNHAAPGVVLYSAVNILQAIGWNLMTGVTIRQNLLKNEHAIKSAKANYKNSFYAIITYIALAILAIWFPLVIAIIITLIWIIWLINGIRIKSE